MRELTPIAALAGPLQLGPEAAGSDWPKAWPSSTRSLGVVHLRWKPI